MPRSHRVNWAKPNKSIQLDVDQALIGHTHSPASRHSTYTSYWLAANTAN